MSQGNWKRYVQVRDLEQTARTLFSATRQAAIEGIGEVSATIEGDLPAALQRWSELTRDMTSVVDRTLFELEIEYAMKGKLPISSAECLAAARAAFVGQPRWGVKERSVLSRTLVDLSWVIRQGRQGMTGHGIVAAEIEDICCVHQLIVIERVEGVMQMTKVTRTPDDEEHTRTISTNLRPAEYEELLSNLTDEFAHPPEYTDVSVHCRTFADLIPCLELAEAVGRGEPGPEIEVPDRSEITRRLSAIEVNLGRRAAAGSASTVYDLALEHGLIGPEEREAMYNWCNDRDTWNYCGD